MKEVTETQNSVQPVQRSNKGAPSNPPGFQSSSSAVFATCTSRAFRLSRRCCRADQNLNSWNWKKTVSFPMRQTQLTLTLFFEDQTQHSDSVHKSSFRPILVPPYFPLFPLFWFPCPFLFNFQPNIIMTFLFFTFNPPPPRVFFCVTTRTRCADL